MLVKIRLDDGKQLIQTTKGNLVKSLDNMQLVPSLIINLVWMIKINLVR